MASVAMTSHRIWYVNRPPVPLFSSAAAGSVPSLSPRGGEPGANERGSQPRIHGDPDSAQRPPTQQQRSRQNRRAHAGRKLATSPLPQPNSPPPSPPSAGSSPPSVHRNPARSRALSTVYGPDSEVPWMTAMQQTASSNQPARAQGLLKRYQ
ncbi:hypothetical protein ABZP36_026253 [Zizania latifolia]